MGLANDEVKRTTPRAYKNIAAVNMPLIVITGIPSSGKSSRTNELKEYFEKIHGKKVEVVNEVEAIEKAGYDRNTFFAGEKLFSLQ